MENLIRRALEARQQAYAPYSHFKVGAAILSEGRIYVGCNVENAAYPQGSCAEANAISAMILQGGKRIERIVIAGAGHQTCTPCGGCRQRLREFADDTLRIDCVDEKGSLNLSTTLGVLLPYAFGPEHLR